MESLRTWLRRLLGWQEVEFSFAGVIARLEVAEKERDDLRREIAALRVWKHDRAGRSMSIADWETIQAAYAANPENFREQA